MTGLPENTQGPLVPKLKAWRTWSLTHGGAVPLYTDMVLAASPSPGVRVFFFVPAEAERPVRFLKDTRNQRPELTGRTVIFNAESHRPREERSSFGLASQPRLLPERRRKQSLGDQDQ